MEWASTETGVGGCDVIGNGDAQVEKLRRAGFGA